MTTYTLNAELCFGVTVAYKGREQLVACTEDPVLPTNIQVPERHTTAVVCLSAVCLLYSVTAAFGNFHVGFMSRVLCSSLPPSRTCTRNQNWWLSSERQQKRKRQEGEEEDGRTSWEEEAKAGGTEGARHSLQPKANHLNIDFKIYSFVQQGVPKGTGEWVWQLWGLAALFQPVQGKRWWWWWPKCHRRGQNSREIQSKTQYFSSVRPQTLHRNEVARIFFCSPHSIFLGNGFCLRFIVSFLGLNVRVQSVRRHTKRLRFQHGNVSEYSQQRSH